MKVKKHDKDQIWDIIQNNCQEKVLIKKVFDERQISINDRNYKDDGWTALHYITRGGNLEILKMLIETYHADPCLASSK